MISPRSILVVDDDDVFRERLVRAFADRGYNARGANSASEAVAVATETSPRFAVVDLRMPDRSGLSLIKDLKELDASTSIVVLTGYGSIATALEAVRLGATNYLTKPATVDDIEASLTASDLPSESDLPPIHVPSLARVEWEHIERVLRQCDGNITQAAKLLGIHRRSLQRKLSKYPSTR